MKPRDLADARRALDNFDDLVSAIKLIDEACFFDAVLRRGTTTFRLEDLLGEGADHEIRAAIRETLRQRALIERDELARLGVHVEDLRLPEAA